MKAPRRAIYALDGQRWSAGHDALVDALAEDYEEIVVAILKADEGFTAAQPLTGGQRVERLTARLRGRVGRPFCVLPIKGAGLTAAQLAVRLGLYAPAFEALVVEDEALAAAARWALGCRVRVEALEGVEALAAGPRVARGLFIARAQPFHAGHAAFVAQMAEEQDEVIVLVAMANASHGLRDPATAGERVEMIWPALERIAPGRHFLAAAPWVDHDAANVPDLRLILPDFGTLYTNSPSTKALAGPGVAVRALKASVEVSGTEIRRRIIAGEPFEAMLPPETARVMGRLPVAERLRALAQPERRGQEGG